MTTGRHPSWCERTECRVENPDGPAWHLSRPVAIRARGTERFFLTLQLFQDGLRPGSPVRLVLDADTNPLGGDPNVTVPLSLRQARLLARAIRRHLRLADITSA